MQANMVQSNWLHAIASQLAVDAGPGVLYKLREAQAARRAGRPLYSVTLKHWNKKRGTHVFTIDPRLAVGGL